MSRITTRVVTALREIPGVANVGAHVGRAVASDRVAGIHESQVWVRLTPKADYDATVDAVEALIDGYPGIEADLTTYSDARIDHALAGESDKLVVRVYGQDAGVLAAEARRLRAALGEVEGIDGIEIQGVPVEPTVEIRVDLARAREHGIKPGDVRRAAATLLSGLEVGSLFEEKKVFDVIVWGAPETRSGLSDIENLLIETPGGAYVRLGEVADVAITPHPILIRREGVARYTDLEIDIRGRPIEGVAADIRARLGAHAFPMEYHADLLGNYRLQADRHRYAQAAALAALLGVFLVLQAALRSWRLAVVVMSALPVSVLGGVLAIALSGEDFGLGAWLGLLSISGLAARFALLLYTDFQRLERVEGMAFGAALTARGVAERAASVIATTLAVAAVVLPFAFMTGAVGMEMLGPMAVAILGGLMTTLIMIFFVLPVFYLGMADGATAHDDFENLLEAKQ